MFSGYYKLRNNRLFTKRWTCCLNFSTKDIKQPTEELTGFERIAGYLVKNRQVFFNITGMLCLIGYISTSRRSVKEMEMEYQHDRMKSKEYSKVLQVLQDDSWLGKVENQIRISKPSKGLLKTLLDKKIKEVLEDNDNDLENEVTETKLFATLTGDSKNNKSLNDKSKTMDNNTTNDNKSKEKPKFI